MTIIVYQTQENFKVSQGVAIYPHQYLLLNFTDPLLSLLVYIYTFFFLNNILTKHIIYSFDSVLPNPI